MPSMPSMNDPTRLDAGDTGMFDFYVGQLEEYLDGELAPDDAAAVRRRLAEEPAYAAALDRLSGHRRLRVAALDPAGPPAEDDAAHERLTRAASSLCNASPRGAAPFAWHPLALAAAAALVVGFALGLLGGLDLSPAPDAPPTGPVTAASNPRPAPRAPDGVVTVSDAPADPAYDAAPPPRPDARAGYREGGETPANSLGSNGGDHMRDQADDVEGHGRLPADLRTVVEHWSRLPDPVRAGIVATVKAVC